MLAGVSPAPKQGPQNAVLSTAPVCIILAAQPFLIISIYTGIEAGYTLNVNAPFPIYLPSRISAAAQMFSNPPPAQPAIIPCSTTNLPSFTLSLREYSTAPSSETRAFFSTSSRMSKRFSFNSSIVYVLLGWKGIAIIGLMVDKSILMMPS